MFYKTIEAHDADENVLLALLSFLCYTLFLTRHVYLCGQVPHKTNVCKEYWNLLISACNHARIPKDFFKAKYTFQNNLHSSYLNQSSC